MTFEELFAVIEERKQTLPEGSGTTHLLTKGLDSILPKLNEESFEVALALENQGEDDVALEVSQCYYYLLCLAVFLGEPFDALMLEQASGVTFENKHECAKEIARVAAVVCHTPCLQTINRMPPLLLSALDLGGSDIEKMKSYL
jgi:phosphoribosyl-ATP pyrophosphohydrolase